MATSIRCQLFPNFSGPVAAFKAIRFFFHQKCECVYAQKYYVRITWSGDYTFVQREVSISIWIVLSISVYLIYYKLPLNKASSLNATWDCNGVTLTLHTLHVEVESFDCRSFDCVRVNNKRRTTTRDIEKVSCISVGLELLRYELVYLQSDKKRLEEKENSLYLYVFLQLVLICHKAIGLVTFV